MSGLSEFDYALDMVNAKDHFPYSYMDKLTEMSAGQVQIRLEGVRQVQKAALQTEADLLRRLAELKEKEASKIEPAEKQF